MTINAEPWTAMLFDRAEAAALLDMTRATLARRVPMVAPDARGDVLSFADLVALGLVDKLVRLERRPLRDVAPIARTVAATDPARLASLVVRPSDDGAGFVLAERPDESGRGLCLSALVEELATRAAAKRTRSSDDIGRVTSSKGILGGKPVLAGTRVPVTAVAAFLEDGHAITDILREFPSLTRADVETVARGLSGSVAA
jgi:uncharacterized protein (DUF433 family)